MNQVWFSIYKFVLVGSMTISLVSVSTSLAQTSDSDQSQEDTTRNNLALLVSYAGILGSAAYATVHHNLSAEATDDALDPKRKIILPPTGTGHLSPSQIARLALVSREGDEITLGMADGSSNDLTIAPKGTFVERFKQLKGASSQGGNFVSVTRLASVEAANTAHSSHLGKSVGGMASALASAIIGLVMTEEPSSDLNLLKRTDPPAESAR